MTRYGATPDEWRYWIDRSGVSQDLLPVVSNPTAPVSAQSALKQAGKVPSRYTRQREVTGIAKWTAYQADAADLARWSAEPDYGICVQTRTIKAIDLDLTAADVIRTILDTLEVLTGSTFPVRCRANSTKCLLIFRGDFPLRKRVIPTDSGLIEILGTGNQFVACGTHPSGARYEWVRWDSDRIVPALPAHIPTLTEEEFETVWTALCTFASGTVTIARDERVVTPLDPDATPVEDPVIPYLESQGLVLGRSPSGRVYLPCPWKANHTTQGDKTETAYFPAGTGGYALGHFDCRHAGCLGKTDAEFLTAIGYTEFTALDGFEILIDDYTTLQYAHTEPTPGSGSPLDGPAFNRDTRSGMIKPLLQNVVLALSDADFCGHRITRDDFRDVLLLDDQPFKDSDYTKLTLNLVKPKLRFLSISNELMRQAVAYVAEQHAFDSAIQWLRGLPAWDGVERVTTFATHYLGVEPSAYSRAVSRYWWTAHAGRVLSPGCQADIAIVLISTQGTGKTSAIKAMVPHADEYVELSLLDRDEDLSRAMRGKLIGEMAELRGLNSRDLESIKAWISRQREEWVPKYLEFSRTFPRRLVLVGTSNQEEFLADETGNRRFAPLLVGVRQDRDGIARDRNQLWAEAAVLYQEHGILWQEAELLAKAEHSRFEIHDAWLETVREWLHEAGLQASAPADGEFIRMEDVMKYAIGLDLKHVKPYEQLRTGKILHQLGYRRANRRVGNSVKKVWVKEDPLV